MQLDLSTPFLQIVAATTRLCEKLERKTDLFGHILAAHLADPDALVHLSTYERTHPTITQHPDQALLSPDDRRGKLQRLVWPANSHKFSLSVRDENVVAASDGKFSTGAYRTFSLTTASGTYGNNWSKLALFSNGSRTEIIADPAYRTDPDQMFFANFVDPRRAALFGSNDYLLLHVLRKRLTLDLAHFKAKRDALKADAPPVAQTASRSIPTPSRPVQISVLMTDLDITGTSGKLSSRAKKLATVEKHRAAANRTLSAVQALIRSVDLAYHQYGNPAHEPTGSRVEGRTEYTIMESPYGTFKYRIAQRTVREAA